MTREAKKAAKEKANTLFLIKGKKALPVASKNFFGEDLREQGVRVRPAGFLSALNLVTANGFLPGVGPREVWTLEFFEDLVTALPKAISKPISPGLFNFVNAKRSTIPVVNMLLSFANLM